MIVLDRYGSVSCCVGTKVFWWG